MVGAEFRRGSVRKAHSVNARDGWCGNGVRMGTWTHETDYRWRVDHAHLLFQLVELTT
jgi:hypothetical protein